MSFGEKQNFKTRKKLETDIINPVDAKNISSNL